MAWIFSTFLMLLLVSFLHSSSAEQSPFYPSAVPDETVKKIIIDALRKEWKGFKFPKTAESVRSFYNIISPLDGVETLMENLKGEEGGVKLGRMQIIPDVEVLSNFGREEQEGDQLNERKNINGRGRGGDSKYIYRLKDSFPKLNEDAWDIDVPVGTGSAPQWTNNMFDEEKHEIGGKEDKDGKNGNDEQNDEHNLPNYLSLAEIGEKRTKREATNLRDLCRIYLRLC